MGEEDMSQNKKNETQERQAKRITHEQVVQPSTTKPAATTEATTSEQPLGLFEIVVRPASRCGCDADDGFGGDDAGCDTSSPSPCEAEGRPGRADCPAGCIPGSTTDESENEVCRCELEVEVDFASRRLEQPTRR